MQSKVRASVRMNRNGFVTPFHQTDLIAFCDRAIDWNCELQCFTNPYLGF